MTEYKRSEFGILEKDIVPRSVIQPDIFGLYSDTITSPAPEVKFDEPTNEGIYVSLAYRAFNLLNATDKYCVASQLEGFDHRYHTDPSEIETRYNATTIDKILNSEGKYPENGDTYFTRAFGAVALLEVGYDENKVFQKVDKEISLFKDEYIGSKNESKREKYRTVLRRQIKQQNELKAKKTAP